MKKLFLLLSSLFLINGCTKDSETYDFQLKGNPSTGYEWFCTSDSDIIDISVKLLSTTNDKTVTGAPVLYSYKLTGIKEGETTIKCIYKREWEDEIDKEINYKVVVDKELNVNISEIK